MTYARIKAAFLEPEMTSACDVLKEKLPQYPHRIETRCTRRFEDTTPNAVFPNFPIPHVSEAECHEVIITNNEELQTFIKACEKRLVVHPWSDKLGSLMFVTREECKEMQGLDKKINQQPRGGFQK